MIELKPISFDDLKPRISTAFMGDRKILDYHESPGSMEHMVNHTYQAIIKETTRFELAAFDVILDGQPIGYTILNHTPFPLLYSFCIQKSSRADAIKKEWVQAISDYFDDIWMVGLNNCNTRAINFFLSQGFSIAHEDNIHNTKLLLCQPFFQH